MAYEDGEVMPFASQTLRDRKRMFYDGAAVATISLDEENEVVGEPQVAVLGMADPLDGEWGDTLHNAFDRLPRKAESPSRYRPDRPALESREHPVIEGN